MTTTAVWTDPELAEFDANDEVRVASVRADGTMTGGRVIWAVRLGNEVYVRSVNGPTAAWYRATRARSEGRLQVGSVSRDVAFVDIDESDPIGPRIDAAYTEKYRRYARSTIGRINAGQARATTIKLVPR